MGNPVTARRFMSHKVLLVVAGKASMTPTTTIKATAMMAAGSCGGPRPASSVYAPVGFHSTLR